MKIDPKALDQAAAWEPPECELLYPEWGIRRHDWNTFYPEDWYGVLFACKRCGAIFGVSKKDLVRLGIVK